MRLDPKTGAAVGAVIVVAAALVGWVVTAQRAMQADYERNARAQERNARARAERREERDQAEARRGPELEVWDWIGEVGWPTIDTANVACRDVQHCRDLPGPARAGCFTESLPRCATAVETLERIASIAPTEVAGLWRFRAIQDRQLVCVYEQARAAHRERATYMDRVRAGVSSEEHVSDGGAALGAYDRAISTCMSTSFDGVDLGSTDHYLRAHFGCQQVGDDGRPGPRVCCTAERVARMYVAGIPPLPPDPSCG